MGRAELIGQIFGFNPQLQAEHSFCGRHEMAEIFYMILSEFIGYLTGSSTLDISYIYIYIYQVIQRRLCGDYLTPLLEGYSGITCPSQVIWQARYVARN